MSQFSVYFDRFATVKKMARSVITITAITTIGMLAMTSTATTAKNIEPMSADYSFTVDDKYKGSANRRLAKSGNTWKYIVKASVAGVASANQNSTFTLVGNNVIPQSADTTYKIFGIGRTHRLSFNSSKKQVVSTYKGQSKTLAMPKPAFDDLSLEVQIRQDLLNDNFSGNYQMVKKSSIEQTPFKRSATTKVTVPAGSFEVVRVDRVHEDKDRHTSFWLAPSLDYLPVKVTQVNDGKKIELALTKIH